MAKNGVQTRVAVKVSWERAGESEAASIQKIQALGVPNTTKVIGHTVLANLAAGDLRSKYLAVFHSHDLHPEVDNRFLHIKIMKDVVTPLAHVQHLPTFLIALLSLMKGNLNLMISRTALDADRPPAFVGHKALADAGYLHGNISPEHLTVNTDDHSQGVLVGFSNIIDLSQPSKHTILPVSLIAAPVARLQPKNVILTYDHELESIFWCIQYILQNYRGGRLISSLATAGWHRGRLVDMASAKITYWHKYPELQEPKFIAFSESLSASHDGFFDFMVAWTAALALATFTRTAPPTYETVVGWLQQSINSY